MEILIVLIILLQIRVIYHSATNITASGGNLSFGESSTANIVGAGDITITPGRNLYLQHFENYSVQIQSTEGVNIIDAAQGQVTITGNITQLLLI